MLGWVIYMIYFVRKIHTNLYTEEAHTNTAPLYCTVYCEAHTDINTFTEVT